MDEDRYFILIINPDYARPCNMYVYEAIVETDPSSCVCPNLTFEEARAFIALMGRKDASRKWVEPR